MVQLRDCARLVRRVCCNRHKVNGERKEAMIARFDHRPMLTAALALATIVLLVVVVTLSTLLITAAPPAAPALSGSVGETPPAVFPSERYEGMWNDDGHDFDQPKPAQIEDVGGANYESYDYYSHQPKPAQIGNGADLSAIDRHAEMVASYNK